MWNVCLSLSVALLLLCILYFIIKVKQKKTGEKTFLIKIMLFVFAADTVLVFPIISSVFAADIGWSRWFKTVLVSMHQAIRMFVVDTDFDIIRESVPTVKRGAYLCYTAYAAILYLLSPFTTFSFVFSFIKNVSAVRKLTFSLNKDLMIFSDFNEESVTLAQGIYADEQKKKEKGKKDKQNKIKSSSDKTKKEKKKAIVFTGCPEDDIDTHALLEKAKEINAILFSKDLLSINIKWHRNSAVKFFVFGKDEPKNLATALEIIDQYKTRENTTLYVLSNNLEGELLLNSAMTKAELELAQKTAGKHCKKTFFEIWNKILKKKNLPKAKPFFIRRVSNVQKAVFNVLDHFGAHIFKEAKQLPQCDEKGIGAVVIGLGKYGSEMTRSLAWFGQMDGYRMTIDAFDLKQHADDIFAATCPELMSTEHNFNFDDIGESQYGITIHPNANVNTVSFENEIQKLTNITYVFIALGNDEKNVRAAVRLRMIFARMGIHPRIQAVVENVEQKKALGNVVNEKGKPYEVDFVGSVDDVFAYQSIINSDLEAEALQRHLFWSNDETKEEDEKKFYKYNYNYSSSMASALHKRMKKACKINGIDKNKEDREENDKIALRKMEHRRWNAYMRSQGYVYAPTRNDLAKTHPCLVTFDKLSLLEQEKDDD